MTKIKILVGIGVTLWIIVESSLSVMIFKWLSGWFMFGWLGLMALVGLHILYRHYLQLERLRDELKKVRDRRVLLEKLILPFLSGWLLLIPGFGTDVLAVFCWLPYLARVTIRRFKIY